jgi:hypothetical protein
VDKIMPSIVPNYVYSLFAALIVGTIIVFSCNIIISNIKNQAESQQLTNIEKYIATQSLKLITQALANNENATQFLEIPSSIGTKPYWIRIANDSQKTWVESGFGTNVNSKQQGFSIPAIVSASGNYVSTSGRAYLNCYIENQTMILKLIEG